LASLSEVIISACFCRGGIGFLHPLQEIIAPIRGIAQPSYWLSSTAPNTFSAAFWGSVRPVTPVIFIRV
jgi:hypothetical protein